MLLKSQSNFKLNFKAKQHSTLKKDEAHFWRLHFPKQKQYINYYFSLLSIDEKEKANKFKFDTDREHFSITRGALRFLLSMYLQESPEAIELNYNQWGKPLLSNLRSIYFNISHSGHYSLLAFTKSSEVGVDLEMIKSDLEFEGMVEIIFSDTELFQWNSLTSDKKVDYFYNVWVAREAFLKALGKGWLEDNKRIRNLSLFPEMSEKYRQVYENAYGTLEFLQTVDGYKSAYFVKGLPVKPILINFDNHTV